VKYVLDIKSQGYLGNIPVLLCRLNAVFFYIHPLSIFMYSGFRKQFTPHFITRPVPEAALGQIQLARKLKIIYDWTISYHLSQKGFSLFRIRADKQSVSV
jgi:hypothetical protein